MIKRIQAKIHPDDCLTHFVKWVNTPDSILHCGAHLGEEFKEYKRFGISEIFWNEAQPNLVDKLITSFGQSNVYPGLLSNKDGELLTFYLTDNSLSSSTKVINPTNQWNIKIAEKIILESITLDSLLCKIKVNKKLLPKLIILDLQGGEFEALAKSEIAINNQIDFIVEMSKQEIYKGQKLDVDIIKFFHNLGYRLVYPKNNKIHYDALFLSPRSQQIYFTKINLLKRYLSYKTSTVLNLLYTFKKNI
jgi:FkbM family methyltransferase